MILTLLKLSENKLQQLTILKCIPTSFKILGFE